MSVDTVSLSSGLQPKVFRGGSGPGPVVFLHAAGGVSEADPTFATLAAKYSVVAPLAPGFADLSELTDIADVHDLAIWYDDLFGALGLSGVPVIGHSFGAMVAAELAAHYPERVSRLVLMAPVGMWKDDEPMADLFGTPFTEISDLLWASPDAPGAMMTKAAMAGMEAADAETVVNMMVPMLQGFTAVAKFMWPLPDKGLSRRLRRITAPTLVLWGAEDRLVPVSYASLFEAGIADCQVKVFEGAGHMLPIEAAEPVMAAVGEFLGTP